MCNITQTQINKLVAVECAAIKTALSLHKGTNNRKTYNEAGILPLWHAIQRYTCRYALRAPRIPNSTDQELDPGWNPLTRPHQLMSLAEAVEPLCMVAGVCLKDRNNIPVCYPDPRPPWRREVPDIHTSMQGLTKSKDTNLLAITAWEMVEQLQDEYQIYTDGSILEDGSSGSGIYVQNTKVEISLKLSPTDILSAELTAIRVALSMLDNLLQPPPRAVILTDSQTSLKTIQKEMSTIRPDMLGFIQNSTDSLAAKGTTITYIWIPSHVGIPGNEKADQAAKKGARKTTNPEIILKPTVNSKFNKVDNAIWSMWKEEYESLARHREWPVRECRTLDNQDPLSCLPLFIGNLISRIRTGKWKTKYTNSRCLCGEAEISFQHCLYDCAYPDIASHFQPLRLAARGVQHPLIELQATKLNNLEPLKQAASLIRSSAVAPYL